MIQGPETVSGQLLEVAETLLNSQGIIMPVRRGRIDWADSHAATELHIRASVFQRSRKDRYNVRSATLQVHEEGITSMVTVKGNWHEDLLADDPFALSILDSFYRRYASGLQQPHLQGNLSIRVEA